MGESSRSAMGESSRSAMGETSRSAMGESSKSVMGESSRSDMRHEVPPGVFHIDGSIPDLRSEIISQFQSQEQIVNVEPKYPTDSSEDEAGTDGHRPGVTHPTSYLDTMLLLFRGNIGSGLLAMGDAFKNGGLVFATIATAILGIVCVHAQHMLLNASAEMHRRTKRQRPPGFADTVSLVFSYGPAFLRPIAPLMKFLVNTFLCITQLGFCCVYIVFVANNVKKICDQYGVYVELYVHGIFVIIPILLVCMVRNLKYLTPFSTIANGMMAVGVGMVMYETAHDLPPVSSRPAIKTWIQLPLFFGTAVYAFEGIGLVLPLKNEMSHPELFQKPLGVLNVGMVCVGSIFIAVGFLGYLRYGEEVAGSLTLNMKPGQTMSFVVQALISLAMMLTYPLQFYVPIAITWPCVRKMACDSSFPVVRELIYRGCLVMITFVFAEVVPELGLFISLVGSVSSTMLALMFPPMIDLIVSYQKENKMNIFILVKNALIIILGGYIFISGTFESIVALVGAFKPKVLKPKV